MNADEVLCEQLTLFGEIDKPEPYCVLAKRFLFPPFSVLDSRSGHWQDQKRRWLELKMKSEVGRDATAYNTTQWLRDKNNDGEEIGGSIDTGTSIFDPVLCQLMYQWFCPQDGVVVDPFAGGCVRGVVAGVLQLKYWGCDLRQEQIDANVAQLPDLPDIKPPGSITWVCGDSNETLASAPEADFIFSCPPYGDLEKYSDDPRDLSNMEWDDFLVAYRSIIKKSCDKLKNDRFACFVIGDFRNSCGDYSRFVNETENAFCDCGLRLYNELSLNTAVGSASMRSTKQFLATRKVVKIHQNVLVFRKGDARKATEAITKNRTDDIL